MKHNRPLLVCLHCMATLLPEVVKSAQTMYWEDIVCCMPSSTHFLLAESTSVWGRDPPLGIHYLSTGHGCYSWLLDWISLLSDMCISVGSCGIKCWSVFGLISHIDGTTWYLYDDQVIPSLSHSMVYVCVYPSLLCPQYIYFDFCISIDGHVFSSDCFLSDDGKGHNGFTISGDFLQHFFPLFIVIPNFPLYVHDIFFLLFNYHR